MKLAVMMWVQENVRPGSVFGIITADETKPVLPMLTPKGHWELYRIIEDSRYPDSKHARAAIKQYGYYLMGAGVTVKEAFDT